MSLFGPPPRRSPFSRRMIRAKMRLASILGAVAFALATSFALAQSQPPPVAPPPAAAPASAAASTPPAGAAPEARADERSEAFVHFTNAVHLFEEQRYEDALAEFRRSFELRPNRATMKNIALCLEKLQRYDEALDVLEILPARFPGLSPVERQDYEAKLADLAHQVGFLELRGVEPGWRVTIDGRDRGASPFAAPLRVAKGIHRVRVEKQGMQPIEEVLEVHAGQTSVLHVRVDSPLPATSGRLSVSELSGAALRVFVDGEPRGTTPWEGDLAPGEHLIMLRGDGSIGTQPAAVTVRAGETATVRLSAENLDARLRIAPSPATAAVILDGVRVGRGTWEGEVRAGRHWVEVAADGFERAAREMVVASGARADLDVELEPAGASAARPPARPRIVLGAELGGVLGRLGGDVASCDAPCDRGFGAGASLSLRAGYSIDEHWALSAQVGYLRLAEHVTERPTTFLVKGFSGASGIASDELTWSGALFGASVEYHLSPRGGAELRAGAGVVFGSVRDERTGDFTTEGVAQSYSAGQTQKLAARYLVTSLGAGFARAFGDHFRASVGIDLAAMTALRQPVWDDRATFLGRDGVSKFGAESLSGSFFLLLCPFVDARYAF